MDQAKKKFSSQCWKVIMQVKRKASFSQQQSDNFHFLKLSLVYNTLNLWDIFLFEQTYEIIEDVYNWPRGEMILLTTAESDA